MEVLDILKKTLSFGIGTAVFGAEKLKEFADEMVQRGEMSGDDAKSFVDDMSRKAEDDKVKIQEWIKEQVAKVKPPYAEEDRVKALEERIFFLEAKLGVVAQQSGSCCGSGIADEKSPDPETVASGEEDPLG